MRELECRKAVLLRTCVSDGWQPGRRKAWAFVKFPKSGKALSGLAGSELTRPWANWSPHNPYIPLQGGWGLIGSPVNVTGHAKVPNLGHSACACTGQEAVPGSNVPAKDNQQEKAHLWLVLGDKWTVAHQDFHLQFKVQRVCSSAFCFLYYFVLL